MPGVDITRIVALDSPVLCLDTCTVLDLMRDPTRNTVHAHERQAALNLLAAVEGGRNLVALLADQVAHEFAEHVQGVQDEAEKAIAKLKAKLSRIDAVAAVYGSADAASLAHLDDHVTRARAIVDRWIKATIRAEQGAEVPSRALSRLNKARTPAGKGKQEMKDCVVIESYLEIVGKLRAGGLRTPIVFVSSNINDYCSETGSALKPDLGSEFTALNMAFAPNLAAAEHLLGL
jgi:PIN domain